MFFCNLFPYFKTLLAISLLQSPGSKENVFHHRPRWNPYMSDMSTSMCNRYPPTKNHQQKHLDTRRIRKKTVSGNLPKRRLLWKLWYLATLKWAEKSWRNPGGFSEKSFLASFLWAKSSTPPTKIRFLLLLLLLFFSGRVKVGKWWWLNGWIGQIYYHHNV